jgi:hypothetical protein
MPQYIQLPDGGYFPLKEGEKPEDAWAAAFEKHPQAFGLSPVESLAPKLPEVTPKTGLGSALIGGAQRYGSQFRTGLGGGSAAAEAGVARMEEIEKARPSQVSLEKVKQAYQKDGLLSAAGEALGQVPYAIAEQVPQLASMGAGARLGSRVGSFFGPVGTAAGTGLGALTGQFLSSYVPTAGANLEAQARAQIAEGKPVDVNPLAAYGAAIPGAALDVFTDRLLLGKGVVGRLMGFTDEQVAKKSAQELEKLASEKLLPKLSRGEVSAGTLLKGTAKGTVEIPTEIAQQILERAQAGLPLTSDEALADYGNAAYQAGLLSPLGGLGRVSERGGARSEIAERKKQAADAAFAAEEAEATKPANLLKLHDEYTAAKEEASRLSAAIPAAPSKKKKPQDYAKWEEDTAGAREAASDHMENILRPLREEYRQREDLIKPLVAQRQAAQPAAAPAPVFTAPPVAELMDQYDALYQQRDQIGAQIQAAASGGDTQAIIALHDQWQALTKYIDQTGKAVEDAGGTTETAVALDKKIDAAQKALAKAAEVGDFDAMRKQAEKLAQIQEKRALIEGREPRTAVAEQPEVISPVAPVKEAPAPTTPQVPLLENKPLSMTQYVFPDGTVATTPYDVERYEEEQFNKKYGPQAVEAPAPATPLEQATQFVRDTAKVSVSHLAEGLGIKKQAAAQLIMDLEKAGVVTPPMATPNNKTKRRFVIPDPSTIAGKLENKPFTKYVFPDGSVANTPEEIDAYKAEQFRQKYAPQTIEQPATETAAAPEVPKVETPKVEAPPAGPVQHAIEGVPVVKAPVNELKLSQDVPQFKAEANAEGVVKPLKGKFADYGVAPVQLWRRLDGSLEIISGRHRWDLAKRSGRQTIDAQIFDEAAGFDKKKAATMDAEINIRDGQGTVADYVNYFQGAQLSKEEADARGLTRGKGEEAIEIATNGSPELIAAHRAKQISDDLAATAAAEAPKDSRIQAVAIKAAQNKSAAEALNLMRAVQVIAPKPAEGGMADMFGFDESAMLEAQEMAKIATQKQREVGQRLSAITGASKNPKLAAAEGIDIKDPIAVKRRIAELQQLKASWNNWTSNSDLVGEIRAAMKPAEAVGQPQGRTEAAATPAEGTLAQDAQDESDDQGAMFSLGTTDKQKNDAKLVADTFTGSVVWQEGDLSLVRAYHKSTGQPVYVPAKKNRYVNRDVASDYVVFRSTFTTQEIDRLRQIKNDLEAANAKKHAKNPFIKHDANGLAFSKNVPAEIRSVVEGWKKILGLDTRIYVTTVAEARANSDKFTGPHRAVGSAGLRQGERGSARYMAADDSYYITYTPSTSKTAELELIAHELGHIQEKHVFKKAPAETQAAIKADFDKWLASNKGKTAREHINSMRAKTLAKGTKVPQGLMSEQIADSYWRSFGEWYADQVSRWSTTTDKPLTVVEKFFAKLGAAMRRFYMNAMQQKYLPAQSMQKFLDGIAKTAKNNGSIAPDSVDAAISIKEQKPSPEKTFTGQGSLFRSQGEQAAGMPTAEIEDLIKPFRQLPVAPKITVVQSISELPEKIQAQMERDGTQSAPGMFHPPTETIYLVGDNLIDGADVGKTISHEMVGHFGLRGVLGNSYPAVMRSIYQNNKQIKAEANARMQANPDMSLEVATEESIAERAEKDVSLNWMNRLVNLIRTKLRQWGIWKGAPIGDSEIIRLIRDSHKYVHGVTTKPSETVKALAKIAPSGKETAKEGDVLYRSRKPTKSVVAQRTSAADDLMALYTGMTGASSRDATMAGIKDKTSTKALKLRQRIFDQYAALEDAIKKGLDSKVIDALRAQNLMYFLRFGQQRSDIVGQTVTSGPPRLRSEKTNAGTEYFYENDAGGPTLVGMAQALEKAKGYKEEDRENAFTVYLAGKRAEQVGWNKLRFDNPVEAENEYKEVLAHLKQNPADKAAFEAAEKIYQNYNAGLLDFLVQTGAMSKQKAAELKSITYVPFYRVDKDGNIRMETGDERRSIRIGNIKSEPRLKELLGDSEQILPVFTSAVQNTSMLINMAMRNQTVKDTAFVLKDLGIASRIVASKGPYTDNVVHFRVNGVEHHAIIDTDMYGIPAQMIVEGLEGIKVAMPTIVRMLGVPGDIFRKFTVRNPLYIFRQLVRDPVSAWVQTGTSTVPILDSFSTLAKMATGKDTTAQRLQRAGATSSNVLVGDARDMTKFLEDLTAGKWSLQRAFSKLDTVAQQSDAATRQVIYEDSIKKGMSHQQALMRTLESMNFSRRGTSPSMYLLASLTPFMHSQVQGLDVLYRSMRGQLPGADKLTTMQQFTARAAMLAVSSLAYAAVMQDDEDYKRAKPEERYGNWWVPTLGLTKENWIKIPIPYEIGFLFKALPEAMVNTAFGDEKAKPALSALWKALGQSVPLDIPQALKPALEVRLGSSLFSGDIESSREKEILPQYRYRTNSTEIAKMLGGVGGLSPIQIDYLIRGYTGGVGMAIAQMANVFLRAPEAENVAQPTTKLSEVPLIGSLFQTTEGRGALDATYKLIEEIQQYKGAYNKLIQDGKPEEAMQFANENASVLAASSMAGYMKKTLGEMSKQARIIKSSPQMTTEQKDAALENLYVSQLALSRNFLKNAERTTLR